MKHRSVRHVRIDAIDATRRDDPHRRLLSLHHADLHRRGMSPQQPAVAKVKRVVHGPRRMIGRNVEGFEVVPVVFDFRTIFNREAGGAENLLDATAHACYGMQPPAGLAAPGQGDIDGIGVELLFQLLRFQCTASLIQCIGQCRLRLVDGRACDATRFRIHGTEGFQQRGDFALLAQQANANILQRRNLGTLLDLGKRRSDVGLEISETH